MLLSKISIEDDDIKNDFVDLFLAYEFNLEQVATLEQKIIDKINKKIIKNGDLSKYDVSKDINEPIIFLKHRLDRARGSCKRPLKGSSASSWPQIFVRNAATIFCIKVVLKGGCPFA